MNWQLIAATHGLLWKGAAIIAKAIFAFMIVPGLPPTVFSDYAFGTSIGLAVGLAITFGAFEQLPIFVKGRQATGRSWAPLVWIYIAFAVLTFAAYYLFCQPALLLAAVAFSQALYFFVSGLIRSISSRTFEVITNLPTCLFVTCVYIMGIHASEPLLIMFFVCELAVYITVWWAAGLMATSLTEQYRYFAKARPKWLLSQASPKFLASLLSIANYKGLIIIPPCFGLGKANDAIAVALVIAEAISQMGMVLVHRNYQAYCRGVGTLRESSLVAAALFVIVAAIGSCAMVVTYEGLGSKFSWNSIGWAIITYGCLLAAAEVRYFFWARSRAERTFLGLQLFIVAAQALIVLSTPQDWWLVLLGIGLSVMTVLGLAFTYLNRERLIAGGELSR